MDYHKESMHARVLNVFDVKKPVQYYFTFTKAVDIHAKVILAALSIYKLAQTIHKTIALLVPIVGFIG